LALICAREASPHHARFEEGRGGGGKVRGGKRRKRKGEKKVAREKGFSDSRLLKSEHASELCREEKEGAARTIHREIPWVDRSWRRAI
jgi:hypothetical protein